MDGDGENKREPRLDAATILHMSRVSEKAGRNRIFVVGPFASRVNFFRQQNRALNLVWALAQDPKFRDCKVAVIGTGLAGATAALALAGLDCAVTVYDAGGSFMSRQRDASHRVAHPNVNFWPVEETLEPSTDLPFLNWLSTDAAAIASDLDGEWDRFSSQLADVFGTEVKALKAEGPRIRVVTGEEGSTDVYDYVILATGFLDEEIHPNLTTPRYWDGLTLAPPRAGEPPVFVSGAGDGGLIEALRLAHKKFDAGRLIIQTAQKLKNGPAFRDILEGERRIEAAAESRREAKETRRDAAMQANDSALVAAIDREPDPLNDDIAVTARAEVYFNAARSLRGNLKTWLKASLDPTGPVPSVYLVARAPAPFLANAAPIHKLLIAHAITAKKIGHLRAFIDQFGNLQPPPPHLVKYDKSRTVPRHGAGFNLALLQAREIEALETRQGRFIERLDTKIWTAETYSNHLPRNAEFVRDHAIRAQRLSELFRSIHVSVIPREECFHYSVIGSPEELKEQPPPKLLFGMPLEHRDPVEIESWV